jgi:hypothetical protein
MDNENKQPTYKVVLQSEAIEAFRMLLEDKNTLEIEVKQVFIEKECYRHKLVFRVVKD